MTSDDFLLLTMRGAPPVAAQPHMRLDDWCVLDDGMSLYLAGILPNGRTLRVTTAISSFDPKTSSWVTSSGRVYQTPSPPVQDRLLRELLHQSACVLLANLCLVDRTAQCWSRICSAKR